MATCGLLGSRLLVSIAPWRETEIYLSAVVAFVGGIVVWFLVRREPLMRLMLLVVTVLLLTGFAYGHYRIFIFHYKIDFPLIDRYVNNGPTSVEEAATALAPRDALFALVRDSKGFSPDCPDDLLV